MRHSATLKDICLGQTFLHGEDIVRLEGVAAVLPLIADLVQADVFIDCMDREGGGRGGRPRRAPTASRPSTARAWWGSGPTPSGSRRCTWPFPPGSAATT